VNAPFQFAALWAARVLGLLFFVFMVFMVIGHSLSDGLPPLWRGPVGVQLDSLALILMTVGGVAGWKWPRAASVMVLAGYAIWQAVERRMPWPPSVVEVPLFFGLLYFLNWSSAARPSASRGHAVQ
jgi:hypothetical protein